MSNIPPDYGSGGSGLAANGSQRHPPIADVARDIADDIETMRVAINGALAKLDADATVTDTNYAALFGIAPSAIKTKKVST